MKKQINKKEVAKKTIKKSSSKAKILPKKIEIKKTVLKKSTPKTNIDLKKKPVLKKIRRSAVAKSPINEIKTVTDGFGKKASLKISSEFAIASILVLGGIFGYIFWKGSSEQIFISSENVSTGTQEKSIKVAEGDEPIEKWKLFRNEDLGNEFRLPRNWKILEEENKFISEDSPEEIVIVAEENKKDYTAEDLLEMATEENEKVNAQQLSQQAGIKLEEREGDILKQTAKILLGSNIVTVTYSTYGSNNSNIFFEKIVPSFKPVEQNL